MNAPFTTPVAKENLPSKTDLETVVCDAFFSAETAERIIRALGFESSEPPRISPDDSELLLWVVMEARNAALKAKETMYAYLETV